ncbi:MAG: hypothetical protein ABEJ60_01880 [Halodesulfurarchaeum sp.]
MDLSELHRVQRQERSTDSLQELRESFYADVAAYIDSLREKRADAADAAADPFRSSRVSELTDEIETAEHVAEAIYQRRIGKLVEEATLAATGNGRGIDGLTAEERALYEDLVERIQENRQAVLETVAGDRTPATESDDADPSGTATDRDSGTAPDPDAPASAGTGTETESSSEDSAEGPSAEPSTDAAPTPAEAMGPESETDATDEDEAGAVPDEGVDRTTVRITADVGEIFGVDAEDYELHADDVVDLPRENADPLVDRDAAERVE